MDDFLEVPHSGEDEQNNDEGEILLDIVGVDLSASMELATKIVAGLLLVYVSVQELLAELKIRKSLK